MRKRYVILGLSVVLALALAVPAFGGPTNPLSGGLASVKKTAKKALKNANAAKKTANSALTAAESATAGVKSANAAIKGVENDVSKQQTEIKKLQTSVTTAQNTANSASTAAAGAKSVADEAKAAAAAAEANANTRLKGSTEVFGETSASSESTKFASVECPAGSPTLGGGYVVGGAANKAVVTLSEKNLYNDGWFVGSQQIAGQAGNWTIQAVAMCGTK
jgi:uncharacterized phage infection (PIP) family protein YhgE